MLDRLFRAARTAARRLLTVRREFDWALAFQAQRWFGLAHSVVSSLYRASGGLAAFWYSVCAFLWAEFLD